MRLQWLPVVASSLAPYQQKIIAGCCRIYSERSRKIPQAKKFLSKLGFIIGLLKKNKLGMMNCG